MSIFKHLKFIIPSILFLTTIELFFASQLFSINYLTVLFLISIISAFWVTRYRFLPIILILLFTSGSVLALIIVGNKGNISYQQLYNILTFILLFFVLSKLYLFYIQQEKFIIKYIFLPLISLLSLYFTSLLLLHLNTNVIGYISFQQLYILLVSITFFFALVGLDRFFVQQEKWLENKEVKPNLLDSGFNLNQTIILVSIFLASSGAYGIYIIFDLPIWTIMLAIFFLILLSTIYLTRINFLKCKASGIHLSSAKNKTFSLYSFLLAFIMLELTWALSFWPANHLIIGSVILSAYYCFWNILKGYLRNEFSRKTVFVNLIFLILFIGLIVFVQDWRIK